MEVSALNHAGAAGLHGRSPLLRLQSDERLIALTRRGSHHAFEALVGRYQARLLAFCRHMLGSKEDAEDVLQEVFAAAFNAMMSDEREINVRPWLYRIARNRSLNHLRKTQALGVDSMDVHLSEHGQTTADKVHKREEFRLLVADVQDLPETQRTALLLREIDALSYEQISEVMETTVPSVKSLLVRARVSLAEAAEARLLSCEEVRLELGEVAEGLKRTTAPVRRHLRQCDRCTTFRKTLRTTNRQLAAVLPVGPLFLLKKAVLAHLGTGAAAGGSSAATGAAAGAAGGAAAGGALQAGVGAVATKAAAGLAAAAIVTAGAVEVKHAAKKPTRDASAAVAAAVAAPAAAAAPPVTVASVPQPTFQHAAAKPAAPEAAPTDAAKAAPEESKAPEEPAAAPTPAAGPAPAVLPTEPQIQRDVDTTKLPDEAVVRPEQSGGALAPEEPPAEQPVPAQQHASQPAPASEPEPTASPEPAPTAEPTPTAEPEPTPEATPPAPEPTPPAPTPPS